MKVKKLAAVVAVSIIFCGIAFASNYIKPDDISRVNLGDTFNQVTQKIGQQQMVSKSFDAQGKEQIVWLYNATLAQQRGESNPGQKVLEAGLADADSVVAPRTVNVPYLIIFTDGKVSRIARQDQYEERYV